MILKGKNVVITGGGRGIGRAVAIACAKEGANMGLFALEADELEATKKDIENLGTGSKVVVKAGDITKYEDVEKAFKEMNQDLGPFNGVIANAGTYWKKETHELDPATFSRVMNVNVLGVFYTFKAAYGLMKKDDKADRARFIITGSAIYPNAETMPKYACYAASKWAVAGFQKSIATEYAKENISFAMVLPTMVDTKLLRGKNAGDGQKPPTVLAPEELGVYYVFLLSGEANKLSDVYIDVMEMQSVRKFVQETPADKKASWDVFKEYFEQKEQGLAQNTRKLRKLTEFFLTHN
nr:SDR family NAD(P)-dependent oxidoreductase [Candidatus Sigynarchaeum springense]